MSDEKILGADAAAPWVCIETFRALMGVSRRTVYNWLYAGKLRYARTVGGDLRIDPVSGWVNDMGPKTPWTDPPSEWRVSTGRNGGRAKARNHSGQYSAIAKAEGHS